jgi:hypothetical protein
LLLLLDEAVAAAAAADRWLPVEVIFGRGMRHFFMPLSQASLMPLCEIRRKKEGRKEGKRDTLISQVAIVTNNFQGDCVSSIKGKFCQLTFDASLSITQSHSGRAERKRREFHSAIHRTTECNY